VALHLQHKKHAVTVFFFRQPLHEELTSCDVTGRQDGYWTILWSQVAQKHSVPKLNLRHLKEKLKIRVACGRSDVSPRMTTMSATVEMAVKWRLGARKRFVCSSFIPQSL
jgi:hypothetical protein